MLIINILLHLPMFASEEQPSFGDFFFTLLPVLLVVHSKRSNVDQYWEPTNNNEVFNIPSNYSFFYLSSF